MAAPKPAVPPAPSPPATAPPAVPVPRSGEVRDSGGARHDSIRAQRWVSEGAVKVLGDVEADVTEVRGLVSVQGRWTGGSAKVHGTLDAGGEVTLTGALELDGEAELARPLHAGSLNAAGAIRIHGSASLTGAVRSDGHLDVAGSLTATSVDFRGRLTVQEEIVTPRLVGQLRGESSARTIRAERVELRRAGRFGAPPHFWVTLIEAKEAILEHVEVEVGRADRVDLGPGAQVARVEGTVVRQHPSAHVGPVSRTPAPYGLTR